MCTRCDADSRSLHTLKQEVSLTLTLLRRLEYSFSWIFKKNDWIRMVKLERLMWFLLNASFCIANCSVLALRLNLAYWYQSWITSKVIFFSKNLLTSYVTYEALLLGNHITSKCSPSVLVSFGKNRNRQYFDVLLSMKKFNGCLPVAWQVKWLANSIKQFDRQIT